MTSATSVTTTAVAARRFEEVDREFGRSGEIAAVVTLALGLWFRDEGHAVVVGSTLPVLSHLVRRAVVRSRFALFRWAKANTLTSAIAITIASLGTGGFWSPILLFAPLIGVIATTAYPDNRRWIWLSPAIVAVAATASPFVDRPEDARLFGPVCLAFVALAIPRFVADFVTVEIRKRRQALIDPLTGCLNRSALEEQFEDMSPDSEDGAGIGLIMFDIDFFKTINDSFGHDVGDEVLRSLSGVVQSALDHTAPLFRIGGEEFLVLLPADDISATVVVAERIRCVVEAAPLLDRPVTVSVGAAHGHGSVSLAQMMRRADHAMLHSKQSGRNRVEAAGHVSEPEHR